MHSATKSSARAGVNPIVKGRSRPSSGVGISLLDAIGHDVKILSLKDIKPPAASKIEAVDIIKSLNPSFRPPSAPNAPPDITFDAPNKRSKSASLLPALPRKSRPSSRTSFHSSASVFIDDDLSVEGLSNYGFAGTASATPRSEFSSLSRISSAQSRPASSFAISNVNTFHTSRDVAMGELIDDVSIDHFLIDFKRKSRMPFSASKIQSWWRMTRQHRAYWRYRCGKSNRLSIFKKYVFNGWHGYSAAQGMCRNLYLNVSLRYWIKYVLDSKGWVNFCAEACNIVSQQQSGLPARVLWNICIQPSTWISAQDEDRGMGDPLPIRNLVIALQSLRVYSSKCVSRVFRRWLKAFRWGAEQRAKGRLKLGHLLRNRFKEKFHLKFQMWSRWAFFTRAKRMHTPLPVFSEYIPFWASWIERKKRKLMYSIPLEKSFWFRWMFLKFKNVCREKGSKNSKLSLVDQVFCISRMKHALSAWTKGIIVIRSELAFLHSRWKLFCLAIRMRKSRHQMKKELLQANAMSVKKRAFSKWMKDTKFALSYLFYAHNKHQLCGSIPILSRAIYIWSGQRAHSIFVSVFMKWSQRARERITWTAFLCMHAAYSQKKLMRSVFDAWRLPAQASFSPISDSEVVAIYILSHCHDSKKTSSTFGGRSFHAISQQIADARNYTFVRAIGAMQSCPLPSGDKLCIQLTSTLSLQQVKAIVSIKPAVSSDHFRSSVIAFRNLNDVIHACRTLLGPTFVDECFARPRNTYSKEKDVSDCNWGYYTLISAVCKNDRHEYRQDSASLLWTDIAYLASVSSNCRAHEGSLRQHSKMDVVTSINHPTEEFGSLLSNDAVSRSMLLMGMRLWLSSVVSGWDSMSALVPLVRNVAAVWELRLKERRALILRDNLIIISGKVRDESSVFAQLFNKKVGRKGMKRIGRKKMKSSTVKIAAPDISPLDNINGGTAVQTSPSMDCSVVASPSVIDVSKSTGFPQSPFDDSIIKLPCDNISMIQRLTNMVHCGGINDPISSFALSENISEAMEFDSEIMNQQLHNRYASIASSFTFQNDSEVNDSDGSDDCPPQLDGVDSDEDKPLQKTTNRVNQRKIVGASVSADCIASDAPDLSLDAPASVTMDVSSSSGPDFQISLAMKAYIAPKPIRVPRVTLPISTLAIARDLAEKIHRKYEEAKSELPSQILEVVAHKLPERVNEYASNSEDEDDPSLPELNPSITVNSSSELQFISDSENKMIVHSDTVGVQVKSMSKIASDNIFDLASNFEVHGSDIRHFELAAHSAATASASFSSLQAKSSSYSSIKGKPFENWSFHDENSSCNTDSDVPVLVVVPKSKSLPQNFNSKRKPESSVFSPPRACVETTSPALPVSTVVSPTLFKNSSLEDFSLPEIPDIQQLRQSNLKSANIFPSTSSPSKQNNRKIVKDRLEELISNVNPSSSKQTLSTVQTLTVQVDAGTPNTMIPDNKSNHILSEAGHINALKRKIALSENANAAKNTSYSEEAVNRRRRLLHQATESAYDALELMAPHMQVIFEENFDALINWFINANARNSALNDHHDWYTLSLERNEETRAACIGELVADADQYAKRVFLSRQHYRAIVAKPELSIPRSRSSSPRGNDLVKKSKPSVEQERERRSKLEKSAPHNSATFTSGDREFVTGITRPIAPIVAAAAIPVSSDLLSVKVNFDNFGKRMATGSYSRPIGLGTTLPFSKEPPTFNVTPRDDALVPAPEFTNVDSRKLNDIDDNMYISGSEMPNLVKFDNAESMFRSVSHRHDASISKSSSFNSALLRTGQSSVFNSDGKSASLPVVGGKSLGILSSKQQPIPKLEPHKHPTVTILEKAAIENVQGIIHTKSILKPAPLPSSSSRMSTQTSGPLPVNRVGAHKVSRTEPTSNPEANIVSTEMTANIHLVPRALNSDTLLGNPKTKQSHSDLVRHATNTLTQGEKTSPQISPRISPLSTESHEIAYSYNSAQAVEAFNLFLASFSLDSAKTSSQDLKLAVTQLELELLNSSLRSSRESSSVISAFQVPVPLSLTVSDQHGLNPVQVISSQIDVEELQGSINQSSSLPLSTSFQPLASIATPVRDRQLPDPAESTEAQIIVKEQQGSINESKIPPLECEPVHQPSTSSRISAVIPRASFETILNPSSYPEKLIKQSTTDFPYVRAISPLSQNTSVSDEPAKASDEMQSESGNEAVEAFKSNYADSALDGHQPKAETASLFSSHISISTDGTETRVDDDAASSSASQIFNNEGIPSDAVSASFASSTPSLATSSVNLAPHSTPYASQSAPETRDFFAIPAKASQPTGVKSSAIRSFLLNIHDKSTTIGGSALSPAEVLHQQRVSAIELVRQRNSLDQELKRNGDLVLGSGHPSHSSLIKTRRSVKDTALLDESDEDIDTGHIFRNHKIKSLRNNMSQLSRGFNALRSMYPPTQEIGEVGDIVSGVEHFHDASSRITDRSADNSAITNRLSAFIAELGKRSLSQGAVFTFDIPDSSSRIENTSADSSATDAQNSNRALAARAAKTAAEDLIVARNQAREAAMQLAVDKLRQKEIRDEPDETRSNVAPGKHSAHSNSTNQMLSDADQVVTLKMMKAKKT